MKLNDRTSVRPFDEISNDSESYTKLTHVTSVSDVDVKVVRVFCKVIPAPVATTCNASYDQVDGASKNTVFASIVRSLTADNDVTPVVLNSKAVLASNVTLPPLIVELEVEVEVKVVPVIAIVCPGRETAVKAREFPFN